MALSRITNPFLTTKVTGTGPATATSPVAQVHGTTNNTSSLGLYNWGSTGSLVDTLSFNRSLSNTIGTFGGAVTSGVDLGAISFSGDDGTSFIEGARIFAEVDGTPGTNDIPGRLVFSTTADGASTVTERMRIDSSGSVGIGSTSPSTYGAKLAVYSAASSVANIQITNPGIGTGTIGIAAASSNFKIYNSYASATLASGAGIDIDTSGNVLVNTTSQVSGERFSVGSGSNVLAAWIQQNTNTSGYNVMVLGLGSNGNNTSSSFIRGNTNAVGNWYLYGNGTTSFTSDQRLKKNIESTRNGYLEDLAQLRVVKYNWLKDNDGTPKELGLIAQEVEQVFPGLVQDDTSRVSEDDETVYKTLKQSVLPFMLLKAIQELKVIVDSQALKIAALESK